MKKINIELNDKYDLYAKYNQKLISKELLDYIIEQSNDVLKQDDININIFDNYQFKENVIEVIKNGLNCEYEKCKRDYHYTNIKQIYLLIIGILFLLLSAIIKETSVFKEVFLIIGWVPIWEAIDIQLFSERERKKKLFLLKKLIQSKYNIS